VNKVFCEQFLFGEKRGKGKMEKSLPARFVFSSSVKITFGKLS